MANRSYDLYNQHTEETSQSSLIFNFNFPPTKIWDLDTPSEIIVLEAAHQVNHHFRFHRAIRKLIREFITQAMAQEKLKPLKLIK